MSFTKEKLEYAVAQDWPMSISRIFLPHLWITRYNCGVLETFDQEVVVAGSGEV